MPRWKGGWQRAMEEDKMSDRRNGNITGRNPGEMHRERYSWMRGKEGEIVKERDRQKEKQ